MFQENLIPSVDRSTISVSVRPHQATDRLYDWHFHRQCEMLMATNGGWIFYTEVGTFELAEGDIIYIGGQVPHSTFTPQGHGGILLQFDEEDEFFLPIHQGAQAVHIAADTPLNEELRPCFSRIAREHTVGDAASDLYIRALTLQIVAALRRAGVAEAPRSTESTDLRPALEYIHAHFARPLSLEEVSKVVHRTPAHFCRSFKKAVGATFLQYLNRLRIHRAEELLADSTLSVGEIAAAVGFCSAAYFAETFRKIHSRSPREYRRLFTDRKV
jgi:AraC-like DNA-binding protein